MKKFICVMFLILFLFLSCGPYYIKGDYVGFKKEVLKDRTKGFVPKISVEPPNSTDSNLKVKVLKVRTYPVIKIKQYQKIRQETQAGLYGILGFLGGALVGIANTKENSSEDSTRNALIYGTGGGLIGVLIGNLVRSNYVVKNSYFEESTNEIIGEEPAETVGVFSNEPVRIFSPLLGKTEEFRTDENGELDIDLSKVFLIDEWSRNNHEFEIILSVRNIRNKVVVDPTYWLKPYILVTKSVDNIRANPWLGQNILGKCYRGEKYRILDQKGNWYKIDYHGRTAWTHVTNGIKVYGSEYQFDPSRPPSLIAQIQFEEPSGNNLLDAEEKGIIHIILKNKGKGPAYNITVHAKPVKVSPDIQFKKTYTLPKLEPGKTENYYL